MNENKSVYIRQWAWEQLDVSIWRNGRWGNDHKNPSPSSRMRLQKVMAPRSKYFASYYTDLGIHCMTLWAHSYNEPKPVVVAIPEVEPNEEFWAPPLEPDPNEAYYDFVETMNDEVAATRS